MKDGPRTIEDAQRTRYGIWGGNLKGREYDPDRCCESVYSNYHRCQCNRPNGYGPANLYCKQHSMKFSDVSIPIWTVSKSTLEIIESDAKRVTDKSVWVGDHREGRDTEWTKVFTNQDKAYEYVLGMIDLQIAGHNDAAARLTEKRKTIIDGYGK